MHTRPAGRRFQHLSRSVVVAAVVLATPGWGQAVPVTPDVGTGPNHRPGAPFRAKLSPPLAEGTVLLVHGRVRDAATGEGIAGSVLDAFQADHAGHYDMDGYEYRARVTTDERGYFELETVVPSNYGPPPHIHLIVTARGYRTTRTEMRFRDAAHPANDRPELTPDLVERKRGTKTYLEGAFDVSLRRGD